MGEAEEGSRIVWGRRQVGVTRCPKSIITPESLYLLGEFNVWKRCPLTPLHSMPARVVDAILVLDNEVRAELNSRNQESHGQPIQR